VAETAPIIVKREATPVKSRRESIIAICARMPSLFRPRKPLDQGALAENRKLADIDRRGPSSRCGQSSWSL
jgi:hypothetical protein